MARRERPLSPFMQYRWLYSNTLSILHRLTGILLSAGFLLLVYWLVAAARGAESYERALSCLASIPMQVILAGVLWSWCYHLLNGVRLRFARETTDLADPTDEFLVAPWFLASTSAPTCPGSRPSPG